MLPKASSSTQLQKVSRVWSSDNHVLFFLQKHQDFIKTVISHSGIIPTLYTVLIFTMTFIVKGK